MPQEGERSASHEALETSLNETSNSLEGLAAMCRNTGDALEKLVCDLKQIDIQNSIIKDTSADHSMRVRYLVFNIYSISSKWILF